MLRTALTALLLASGCRAAEPMDACDLDPAHCLPCAADDECVFTGNPCLETVYCAHKDAAVSVIQIGCSEALEYRWPDPSACTCEGTCTAAEGGRRARTSGPTAMLQAPAGAAP